MNSLSPERNEEERKAFEAWLTRNIEGFPLDRESGSDRYADKFVQWHWTGWLARAELAEQERAEAMSSFDFYATLKRFDHLLYVIHRERIRPGISAKRHASLNQAHDMLSSVRSDFYERTKQAHYNRSQENQA